MLFCEKCYNFIGLYLFTVSIELLDCVKISKLKVPEVTQLGDPVVLDCEYILEDSPDGSQGLVVKWYFNEETTPIYQWIPSKKPQEIGIFKGRLNLEYSASTDSNSVHRALHIIQPGPDLSGDYTCAVSTFDSEDRQTKRMLVYAPERNLELTKEYKGNGVINVICLAQGVFPRPTMKLLSSHNVEVNTSVISVQERDGLFDIKATAEVTVIETPEEFSCELHIPEANYTVKKQTIYYPVADSSTRISATTFVLTLFQMLFFA